MRIETITRTLYQFHELSDKAKGRALEKLWDINVNNDFWHEHICDHDAKLIGCSIPSFSLAHCGEIDFHCDDPEATAKLIIEHHGETCQTYKLAHDYIDGNSTTSGWGPFNERTTGKGDDDALFTDALGEEYLSMLRREYEYLTSEEAIIESIEANEYEFTEDGELA